MSNSVYPVLPGLAWPVKKTPEWSTLVQRAASGRESRVSLYSYPLWNFELMYNVLRAGARNGQTYNEYQQLVDFYNTMGGAANDFLFDDLSDDSVTDALFGVGDGVTAQFQLARTMNNGLAEPVMNVNAITNIKDAGSIISPGGGGGQYTISSTGVITFGTVPLTGHSLTWTGTYYYRCRFAEDMIGDLEQFMNLLWRTKSVKLVGSLGIKI